MNEISEGVYWVGVHVPQAGASINAFLITDKKTTLVDTGAIGTQEVVLGNIKGIVDPSTIDYVVLTHNCVDHCGGLASILEMAENAKVVASELTAMRIPLIYGINPDIKVVKNRETLDLGKRRLKFIYAPYLCKADSMFIYDERDGILFTADAFGSYGDPGTEWKLFAEGDITQKLLAYSQMTFGEQSNLANAIERIKGLDIRMIAPGHGAMIREDIDGHIKALGKE